MARSATLHRLSLQRLQRWKVAAVRHHGSRWPYSLHRYELPAGLAWAGPPGRLVVPLERVTTAAGFSFRSSGWHPHRETIEWCARTPEEDRDPQRSPLARLYERFQPATVQEAIFDDIDDDLTGLSDVPLVRGQLRELWNPYGPRRGQELDRPGLYWGPASPAYLTSELDRTWRLYESLIANGHRENGAGRHAISGYLLVRGDDYRLVIHEGHHRLACLAALPQPPTTVPVYLTHKQPPVVRAEELDRWAAGRRARYDARSARLLFERLFQSTGLDKAQRLELAASAAPRTAGRE